MWQLFHFLHHQCSKGDIRPTIADLPFSHYNLTTGKQEFPQPQDPVAVQWVRARFDISLT
jgi:hypothetical protein